jgi:hypothetical protein
MRLRFLTLALCLFAAPAFAGPSFDATTLTLAWDAIPATDNPTGYTVVRGQTCDTWIQFADVGNVTSYTFPTLPVNEPLCFAVQAYRIESDGTRALSATHPSLFVTRTNSENVPTFDGRTQTPDQTRMFAISVGSIVAIAVPSVSRTETFVIALPR